MSLSDELIKADKEANSWVKIDKGARYRMVNGRKLIHYPKTDVFVYRGWKMQGDVQKFIENQLEKKVN